MLSIPGLPTHDVDVPEQVRAIAAGRPLRCVWHNELDGLTFEIGADPERCFVKWNPNDNGIDLSAETARLAWAATYTPVPRVLGHGSSESGSWLVTAAVPGNSAVSERWCAEPEVAVRAIGTGLRAFHEALPVQTCPFSATAPDRLADAQRRAAAGELDPSDWQEQHRALGVDGALRVLADIPPVDRIVVCHGDTCAPNTLIGDDGAWSGHVDLGELGTGDRWGDLAVATLSLEWNYGPGWETLLLDAYGVPADPARMRYYRLLWDLGP